MGASVHLLQAIIALLCVLQAHVNCFMHSHSNLVMLPATPAISHGVPSEFCTLCICFAYLWSLQLSYLEVLCMLLIDRSCSRRHYIANCQAASVLLIGYCYACIIEFLGLPMLFVSTTLVFLSPDFKSHSPSLGLQVLLTLSWPP